MTDSPAPHSSTTMRAALIDAPAAPFRVATLPRPVAGPGEVLVRIHAAAVNPLDTKIKQGVAAHAKHPLPAILGIDMAGSVEAIGHGVTGFRAGDAVYGMTGGVGGVQGSLAEYAAVDARLLAHKPGNLSMAEAAALPLAVITSWEGLVDRAGVSPGQTVLVQGGSGGVGHVAVQLAQHFGAKVFATGSEQSRGVIESLGAGFIDYRGETVPDYVARLTNGRGFDIVFDTVGGASLDASFQSVCLFGHVVSALGWGTHSLAPLSFRAASYSGIFTLLPLLSGEGREHHGEILEAAARIAEAGSLKPIVNPQHFTLDTADEAYRAVVERPAIGKIVVIP